MARFLLLLIAGLLGAVAPAAAQTCAPPGSLQTTIPAGVINDYYAGNGTPNVLPGATGLTLGTRDARVTNLGMAIGDLLMIIQVQDGTIISANNSTYGNGSGSGNGSTSVGNAGRYEFVRVTGVAGAAVTFTPALTYGYTYVDAAAGTSQKRYQVVKVPQYTTGTAAGVTAPAWDGAVGGVVAMDVQGALTLGSGTVEGQANRAIFVAGKGFRGGLGRQLGTTAGANSEQDWAINSANYHASKGEGFIGSPRYMAIKSNNWGFRATNPPTLNETALANEGYPGGSYARGAPGNAGGGGVDGATPAAANDKNAGGGGGGNYGPGGIGGRPWSRPLLDTGGRGGAGYAGTLDFNRLFMGGGGGAGGSNDGTADNANYTNFGMNCTLAAGRCSSGAAGGGIVVVRARQVTGTGVIDSRGAHGYNVQNDAAGGGGAGGSVVLETVTGGNATIDVTGGDGGNAWAGSAGWTANRHGPGGAGGGGFVAFAPNTMAVTAAVNGGTPGETMNDAGFDEYYGGSGFNGGLTTFQSPNTPGVPPAALCDANLSLRKTNGVTSLTSPGTTTYTFTVANAGSSNSSGTITIADRLPPGLTVVPGTLAVGGTNAVNWSCVAANTTDITCTSAAPIASPGTSVFTLSTAVNGTNGLAIVNKAALRGGGDPNKTGTATVTQADLCTADDTPAGCAVDTDTIRAPNLLLTKTDGVTQTVRGGTVVYSLAVTNAGGTPTAGTITVADLLPTGLTYSGASPFTVAGFTCNVSGQGIICDRTATLAAGATVTITFTAVVTADAPSSVVNRAQVGGGGDPTPGKSVRPTTATAATCAAPTPPANTFSDSATGCASDADQVNYVALELTKDDGQVFVNSGGVAVYRITVQNVGTAATAGQINFGDVLPTLGTGTINFSTAGTFAPGGPSGANWSCTRSTNTYTFCTSAVSIPAGGTSVFNLTATLSATVPDGTQTLNKARVGGGGDVTTGTFASPSVADIRACVADGNGRGCAVDLNTVQSDPQVRMSKSHPDPQARSVGAAFAFTLVVSNSGSSAAAANTVRVVDVVPAGLTIGAVTPNTPFTCATAGQVVTCNNTAGTLAAGVSRTITVAVTVAAGATNLLVNRAKVGATGDPQNSTLPTSVTAVVCSGTNVPTFGCAADTVALNADLRVDKQQRRGNSGAFQDTLLGVAVGDAVQYRISILNAAGSATVSTATFSDLVPFNITGLAVGTITTSGGAAGCSAAFSGSLLNGTVTTLPAGGSCTLIVTGTATTNASAATNTAVVSVPTGISDTNAANNSDAVVMAIGSANLSVVKTNGIGTVTAGTTVGYTITVANLGPSPGDGVRLYDPVAPGLSCVANPVCAAAGGATCPAGLTIGQLQNTTPPQGVAIPTLGAGGTVTFSLVCTVTATGS